MAPHEPTHSFLNLFLIPPELEYPVLIFFPFIQ